MKNQLYQLNIPSIDQKNSIDVNHLYDELSSIKKDCVSFVEAIEKLQDDDITSDCDHSLLYLLNYKTDLSREEISRLCYLFQDLLNFRYAVGEMGPNGCI